MTRPATNPRIPAIERTESLAQQAYRLLRRAIQHQDLVQDTFYSESELAEFMGISRTPVREALIELAREGLVEVIPQRGFRLHVLDDTDRKEVFDLRVVLEQFVVERLAQQATSEDVGKLRSLLDEQRRLVKDPDAFLEVDEAFHTLMPELAGLRLARQMLGTLRGAMWLLGSSALALPERIPDVLEEHTAVVDAIEAGDARAAKNAIQRHVRVSAKAADARAH
jgi:DNA-binding GntR family transcriptional regulator